MPDRIEEYDDGYDSAASFEAAGADRPEDCEDPSTTVMDLAEVLRGLVENHDAEYASHYGEPGYTDPEKGIVFANWNYIGRDVQDFLEAQGYSLEWNDEWVIDYNSNKAYRCSPDSYSWECQFIMGDGDYIFPDDGADAFIEQLGVTDRGQPIGCLPSWITAEDLERAGYSLYRDGLESGHHHGQTDDPAKHAAQCLDDGAERVIFRKKANSQFYVVFECWVLWPEEEQP